MKRSFGLWLLIIALVFLALGGFYGGISMLLDPSGNSLQMAEILPLLPVHDFVLPGLFLLFGMGFAPLFIAYALFARPNWSWAVSLTRPFHYHWAWVGTIAIACILGIWLIIEGLMIGFKWPIQYVTAVNGLVILLLALLPSVKRSYKK
jgi:hypothetical protein